MYALCIFHLLCKLHIHKVQIKVYPTACVIKGPGDLMFQGFFKLLQYNVLQLLHNDWKGIMARLCLVIHCNVISSKLSEVM